MALDDKSGGGGLIGIGLPAGAASGVVPDDVDAPSAEVDPEQEAYTAAAQELSDAMKRDDIPAIAAALRAAASIGRLSTMDLDADEGVG